MRGVVLLVSFLHCVQSSWAFKFAIARPPKASSSSSTGGDNNLINKGDQRYTANITIAGTVVNVILDTGSSDLYVHPPGGLSSNLFNDTRIPANLTFGDGSDFVAGEICIAKFELGGAVVPFQAFVNVQQESADNQADEADAIFGLWGLGFNTPGASVVNDNIQQAFGAKVTDGQSVLANIFQQNPKSNDFLAISLSRLNDTAGTADGSIEIGQLDQKYTAVSKSPVLEQSPPNSGAWTVPMDALKVGGQKITWPSTVQGTLAGSNIISLDTGTTNVLMPTAQVDAIYSAIPGAVLTTDNFVPNVQFSESHAVWVVPCTAQVAVAATFGGVDFPIHPLDLADMTIVTAPDGKTNFTVCIGAFTDIGTPDQISGGRFDALFGDSFLRNSYTVLDFGTQGNVPNTAPFVQMLPTTDATASLTDFTSVRQGLLKTMPTELTPVDLVKVMNGSERVPSSSSSSGSGGSGQKKNDAVGSRTRSGIVPAALMIAIAAYLL